MKFAVIGQPITQSLSPVLHSEIFRQIGLNATYSAIEVSENELSHMLQRVKLGEFDGLNITLPYKSSVMTFLDEINTRAKIIGAINCVFQKSKRLVGNNTDWFGFLMAIQKHNISIAGKEALVLGAGGVARSVVFALKQAGAKQIRVFSRMTNRAQILTDDIVSVYQFDLLEKFVRPNSIIVNCTPIGMTDNNSPMDEKLFSNKQIIIDTIYTPEWTQFRKFGERAGAKTVNGLDMFVLQGIQSLELWLGRRILNTLNIDLILAKLTVRQNEK